MKTDDLFHTGIVVDDFEETVRRLSTLCNYRFGDEICIEVTVQMADGNTATVETAFCYSLEAPHLEILRVVAETAWQPSDAGVHHLGYWSDDLAADAEALVACDYEPEMTGLGSDGTPLFAYYRHASAPRIEIVDRLAQPIFEQYWIDGRNPFR